MKNLQFFLLSFIVRLLLFRIAFLGSPFKFLKID